MAPLWCTCGPSPPLPCMVCPQPGVWLFFNRYYENEGGLPHGPPTPARRATCSEPARAQICCHCAPGRQGCAACLLRAFAAGCSVRCAHTQAFWAGADLEVRVGDVHVAIEQQAAACWFPIGAAASAATAAACCSWPRPIAFLVVCAASRLPLAVASRLMRACGPLLRPVAQMAAARAAAAAVAAGAAAAFDSPRAAALMTRTGGLPSFWLWLALLALPREALTRRCAFFPGCTAVTLSIFCQTCPLHFPSATNAPTHCCPCLPALPQMEEEEEEAAASGGSEVGAQVRCCGRGVWLHGDGQLRLGCAHAARHAVHATCCTKVGRG